MMNRKSYNEVKPPDIIICVEWIDASTQKGPVTVSDLTGVFRLVSVGWLIRENNDHISIGMDYVPDNGEFRDVQHILKRCVVKRTEYKAKP